MVVVVVVVVVVLLEEVGWGGEADSRSQREMVEEEAPVRR